MQNVVRRIYVDVTCSKAVKKWYAELTVYISSMSVINIAIY